MKAFPFEPSEPSIRVPVKVISGTKTVRYRFVLDTGATRTAIRPDIAIAMRLPVDTSWLASVTTASGVTTARYFIVPRLAGLGIEKRNFAVLAQEFPRTFSADGLLGLDFFRGLILSIDFHRNHVRLRSPRPWWQFWK